MPPYGIAFLDPPYGRELGTRALAALREGGWLTEDAIVVLEESASAMPDGIAGYEMLDRRVFGDTAIAIMTPGKT